MREQKPATSLPLFLNGRDDLQSYQKFLADAFKSSSPDGQTHSCISRGRPPGSIVK